jgi:hypothetical protein
VWRSWTTAEIDTFISDVSTTRTNIAIARRTASAWSPLVSAFVSRVAAVVWTLIAPPFVSLPREAPAAGRAAHHPEGTRRGRRYGSSTAASPARLQRKA